MCLGDDCLPFYRYKGKAECSFLYGDLAEVLVYTMQSLYIDNPSKPPLVMGDASSRQLRVSCPGHPTHKNLTEVDFDYPTYSGKGTQYDRGNIEYIWGVGGDFILQEDLIDWWMMWQFLVILDKNLKECLDGIPKMKQFIIHEKIFELIDKNIPYKDGRHLYSIVSLDTERNYNHHTHMHLNLRMG